MSCAKTDDATNLTSPQFSPHLATKLDVEITGYLEKPEVNISLPKTITLISSVEWLKITTLSPD